ncbi:MAG: outer membrane protein transport protein [Myxococcales bacterium]|nr:outer membrane protein transport protein [Myxococcales bacterium]
MRIFLSGAALIAATGVAAAGGLERPNGISARAVAQGGAFCAVADDATAWHWNPGAAAFGAPAVMIGGELVIAPRTYVPIDAAGVRGPAQSPDTPIVPVPSIGVVVRASDRVTVGAGVWNSFGGQLNYTPTGMSAIDATQDLVLEVVGGVAYRVTPRLAIGATVRLGVGLFSVKATDKPITSDLSGSGIGPGVGLGIAWRPHPRVALGATWRSALDVDVSGSGTLAVGAGLDLDMAHTQHWPQSVELGAAIAATRTVRVSAQVDWTGWSSFETLAVRFPTRPAADQVFLLDWDNTLTGRLGVEWAATPTVAVRAGAYVDGNAVPDRTIERQYLDSTKVGGSLGGGVRFGRWRVDGAFDLITGPPRTVPDNRADVGPFTDLANIAPGEHSGSVYTFELAVARRL